MEDHPSVASTVIECENKLNIIFLVVSIRGLMWGRENQGERFFITLSSYLARRVAKGALIVKRSTEVREWN
jgi:hypothetical protein